MISNLTDAVVEEVKPWQNRPLEEFYPIVYLDALMVKVRDHGHVQNKVIYVVLGVNLEGQKKVLGLRVAQSEGAKFWLQVLTELQNRGVKDVFIACVDGLKGFPGSHRGSVSAHRGAAVHRPDAGARARLVFPEVPGLAGRYACPFLVANSKEKIKVGLPHQSL